LPFDSSNFGYRTLPVWLQDFVAGLGPSTMSTLRRGFQQEIVRPGVRINFDREFANRNASMSEVLSQVFTQPGQNALTPGRTFNPIQQNNPEPPIPPLIPVPPGEPTSPPPPSGGSGGSGSGGSGGSGSGSSVAFCDPLGPFGSICDPDCLDVPCSDYFGEPMGVSPPVTGPSACATVRVDSQGNMYPLCGCSIWYGNCAYYSWDGDACYETRQLFPIRISFCCYEGLGISGFSSAYGAGTPIQYVQHQVIGTPVALDVCETYREFIELAYPNGVSGLGLCGPWTTCVGDPEVCEAVPNVSKFCP
jgi:hypothetical protein